MLSQSPSRRFQAEPLFLGFAGRMGAGKTSAAQYLSSKYDLQYTRYSQVLQTWFSADPADREKLQKLGWDTMAGGLQDELNSRLIAGVDRTRGATIDGLRHMIDFERLSSAFGSLFRLVYLESSATDRFGRLRLRFPTYESFQHADLHPVEANIAELKSVADLTILNDQSINCFHAKLDAFFASCRRAAI